MNRLLFVLSALLLCVALTGLAAVVHQHSVQTFGAVDGLPDPALDPRPADLRAINVALEQYDEAGLRRAFDQLAAFGWVRQTFAWDEIEPARGEFDWAQWDQIVAAATARDKKIIAVLNFSPQWARAGQSSRTAPPDNAADFGNFAGAFAARYTDRIDVYQVWDEPNILSGWGDQPPFAARYAALLQAAHTALHAADPTAILLTAGLAPTVETGPDNISDLIYLQQLYDLGAGKYFDAAAGKPYGFYTGPDDRQTDPQLLNFSRFTLLRQVMERNSDGRKLLWASNFGWSTLDSPWGKASPEQQAQHTLAAYQRAQTEWPWAGPLALENYQPAALPDDPRWGFALADPNGQLSLLGQVLSNSNSNPFAPPGNYLAQHPAATYTGAWEFSDLGADIPQEYASAQIQITFQGTDLALRVRRGDYRGYLYVTINGRPANRLPRDARGAYLVLTSPDLKPEVTTLPVASGLAPDQSHTAVIQPERGWDQWAFVGFSVGQRAPAEEFQIALGALGALGVLSVAGLIYFRHAFNWGGLSQRLASIWRSLSHGSQVLLTAIVSGLLYFSAWLTLETEITAFTRRFGDAAPILVTALTAGLFYFSPSFLVAVVALMALFVLFYLRLDIALAFLALFIPFFLFPRLLWERGASLLEFSLWLTLAAWLLKNLRGVLSQVRSVIPLRFAQGTIVSYQPSANRSSFRLQPSSLDLGVFALFIVSTLSLFTAARKDVALYEFRTVILGSAIFYFLLRATPLDHKSLWRVVDFFLLGAVAIAAIGLCQYVTNTNLIMTEEGVARIRSVYGSPNNLGLYLGRALPVALAVMAMGASPPTPASPASRGGPGWGVRRILYGLAALVMGAALVLSFSRGALVLGVPAALAVILIGWQGRRGAIVVGVAAVAGLAALPFLAQLPRFANLFDTQSGTGFFRVNLWLSAGRMFADHPWLGVGLDNFLYAYRSFYILPEAWQEPNLSHPHNIVMDFLSRLGLLGFLCGVWLVVSFWRVALGIYRQLSLASNPSTELRALCLGLMALAADMLAHGLVDHSFFLVDLAFVFMLALALVQALREEQNLLDA